MTNILPITKARDMLTELVGKTGRLLQEFIITVNGKPSAVLISFSEYEALKETADILSDKELVRQLLKSEKEISKGDYVTFEQLKKDLKIP